MTVMLCLGGVQLLSLGIMGEYLGRIFNESKKRPLYLIDELDGQKVMYVTKHMQIEERVKKEEK